MRLILTGLVCLFFALNIFAQTEDSNGAGKEQAVEKISLGREDKDGNIEEDIEVFSPQDVPVYCYIDLASARPTQVKMKVVAVKAKGLRPNSAFVTVEYKTKEGEKSVDFYASPEKVWAVGEYLVEIYLDGKVSATKNFRVAE